MAKRRLLKKNIVHIAAELIGNVLVTKMLVPETENETLEKLLERILVMEESFIRRAHFPDGKDDKKLVKKHYRQLYTDFQNEIDAIVDEMELLRKGKTA